MLLCAGAAWVAMATLGQALLQQASSAPRRNPASHRTRWSNVSLAGDERLNGSLDSISCTGRRFCEGIGRAAGTGTLAGEISGGRWHKQAVSSEASEQGGWTDVSCATPSFCMAVGESSPVVENGRYFAPASASWNGSAWRYQPVAPLSAAGALTSVSCRSAQACIAVGYIDTSNASLQYETTEEDQHDMPLVERWNGTSWAIEAVSNPLPGGSGLFESVSCASATSCVAVGLHSASGEGNDDVPIYARWNGAAWTASVLVNAGGGRSEDSANLESVSCPGVAACMAVGYISRARAAGENPLETAGIERSAGAPLVERLTAGGWRKVASPHTILGAMALLEISCANAGDCVAVQGSDTFGFAGSNVVDEWRDGAWRRQTVRRDPYATEHRAPDMEHVGCASDGTCMAGGEISGNHGLAAEIRR